jgi:hypothetical protein
MFRCNAEYYTNTEPIVHLDFKAWTKRGALKKSRKNIDYVKSLNCGNVYWIQVWFKGKKIYGNGNKTLF